MIALIRTCLTCPRTVRTGRCWDEEEAFDVLNAYGWIMCSCGCGRWRCPECIARGALGAASGVLGVASR